jgi:hypothetical protein
MQWHSSNPKHMSHGKLGEETSLHTINAYQALLYSVYYSKSGTPGPPTQRNTQYIHIFSREKFLVRLGFEPAKNLRQNRPATDWQ